jgi:hypothetical protein
LRSLFAIIKSEGNIERVLCLLVVVPYPAYRSIEYLVGGKKTMKQIDIDPACGTDDKEYDILADVRG